VERILRRAPIHDAYFSPKCKACLRNGGGVRFVIPFAASSDSVREHSRYGRDSLSRIWPHEQKSTFIPHNRAHRKHSHIMMELHGVLLANEVMSCLTRAATRASRAEHVPIASFAPAAISTSPPHPTLMSPPSWQTARPWTALSPSYDRLRKGENSRSRSPCS
jgi:hypothetical protein